MDEVAKDEPDKVADLPGVPAVSSLGGWLTADNGLRRSCRRLSFGPLADRIVIERGAVSFSARLRPRQIKQKPAEARPEEGIWKSSGVLSESSVMHSNNKILLALQHAFCTPHALRTG